MGQSTNPKARRATIRKDHAGEWRYKVQGYNWRTIDAPEEGFKNRATARRRVEQRWPGVEIVIEGTP